MTTGSLPLEQKIPNTLNLLASDRINGLDIGVQLYISRRGKTLVDYAEGDAAQNTPMSTDTLMLWLSAGKPIAAVAMAILCERAKIKMTDTVARHIPEFGAHGKDNITIEHLLTHTAGLRHVAAAWDMRPWDEIIEEICAAQPEPDWEPGRRAGYHLASTWYLLGEITRRVDGRDYADFAREEIFLPLGMNDSWIAMPPETYHEYVKEGRMGTLHNFDEGVMVPWEIDNERGAAHCRPGSSARGPARELGLFYEMLRRGGKNDETRILNEDTVHLITTRHRKGLFDETFNHKIDWAYGLVANSNSYGIKTVPTTFGHHCGEETIGHAGSQSSLAFLDPRYGLVVSMIFNGRPGHAKHHYRTRHICTAIYEDLHLV